MERILSSRLMDEAGQGNISGIIYVNKSRRPAAIDDSPHPADGCPVCGGSRGRCLQIIRKGQRKL